jgi:hypothetical protein
MYAVVFRFHPTAHCAALALFPNDKRSVAEGGAGGDADGAMVAFAAGLTCLTTASLLLTCHERHTFTTRALLGLARLRGPAARPHGDDAAC